MLSEAGRRCKFICMSLWFCVTNRLAFELELVEILSANTMIDADAAIWCTYFGTLYVLRIDRCKNISPYPSNGTQFMR